MRSSISGSQIGYTPAGSLRLGAQPQDTSLRSGGIYGSLLQGDGTGQFSGIVKKEYVRNPQAIAWGISEGMEPNLAVFKGADMAEDVL